MDIACSLRIISWVSFKTYWLDAAGVWWKMFIIVATFCSISNLVVRPTPDSASCWFSNNINHCLRFLPCAALYAAVNLPNKLSKMIYNWAHKSSSLNPFGKSCVKYDSIFTPFKVTTFSSPRVSSKGRIMGLNISLSIGWPVINVFMHSNAVSWSSAFGFSKALYNTWKVTISMGYCQKNAIGTANIWSLTSSM